MHIDNIHKDSVAEPLCMLVKSSLMETIQTTFKSMCILAMVPEQYFLPAENVQAYLELGLVSSSRGLGRAQHESTNVLVKSLGNG